MKKRDRTVHEILSVDYSWGYMQYLQDWTPEAEKVTIPSFEELQNEAQYKSKSKTASREPKSTSKVTSRKRKAASPKPKKQKKRKGSASASELARLLLIFQFFNEIRDRFTQTLTKADLDHGIKSRDFWEDEVAQFFNDANFKPKVSFGPALKEVDPSTPPPTARDGTFLETMLRSSQPAWGEVEGGFHLSEQNCPDFENYLTEVRKRDIFSGIGQVLLACREMVRIGSPHEDTDLLEVLGRKSTALGNEGGLQRRSSSCLMKQEEKSPSTKKPRQRASLENTAVAIADFCDSVKKSMAETTSSGQNWDFNTEADMLKALSEAEKYANDQTLSGKLRKRWKYHYEKIEADMDKKSPVKVATTPE